MGTPIKTLSLVGPTAVGKTALAIELALRLDGEIINGDALQAYRELEIGTAKPGAEERARVPHHLLEIVDPREPYSAGKFAELARSAVASVHDRGKVAVVVGGSGLYHRALFEGLAPIESVDPAVRRRLKEELQRVGPEALHARLARLDDEMASRITPRDAHRTVRALELIEGPGVSQARRWVHSGVSLRGQRAVHLGLTLPRALLYDRIESRVARMFASGWEDEVRGLIRRGIPESAPAFQAIGYREIVRMLRGEASRSAVAIDITQATRRYAKRQLTWFRRTPGVWWIDAERSAHRMNALLSSLVGMARLA